MNPTGNNNIEGTPSSSGEELKRPIVGYCRASGRPLTAEDAVYVNGILYAKEFANQAQGKAEPASPYAAATAQTSSAMGSSTGMESNNVSPGLAFLLGLIPGVGAIYNGQYAKGLVHIVVMGLLASLMDNHPRGSGAIFGLLLTGWIFYMAFEAFHTAQKRQRGQSVTEMSGLLDLPANLQRVPMGPLVLIFAGVVFLLDNLGLLPLEELGRYWPLLLIAAGVALLFQRLNPGSSSVEGNSNAN
jgi:hypothetical protein